MNGVEKVKIRPSMTEETLSAPGNFFSHPLSLHDFEFFFCAAKLPFRRVQFVSLTVQFILQEFSFSSLFF